jgi:quercetin dioxygenase-like cupin family protein
MLALTDTQLDSIIAIAGRLVDHVPAVLAMLGTFFLIIRQWLNKRDTDKKLEENTQITKEVKTVISEADQLRSMTTLAKKLGSTDPVMFPVKLPGDTYEVFGLSEGSKVYWKSEFTTKGRAARFLVEGKCSMGFHFHQVAEILSGVRGTLFYESGEQTVEITPGITFTTPADTVHSARFDAPGEVMVHWPDQQTDELIIGVWP